MRFDILRTIVLSPYAKGQGPRFRLQTRDTGRFNGTHTTLAYTLTMKHAGQPAVTIFDGADYGVPAHESIDSDDSLRGLLNFLCLRPGDTDSEYFEGYTAEQLAFCEYHAEALAMAAFDRFGEEA